MPKTSSPRKPEDFLKIKRHPIYLVVDNVRSMHNVGSFFRTADAVLVKKIYLTGISPKPPRLAITKTAMGNEKAVPWEYHQSAIAVVKKLKKQGVQIIVLEKDARAVDYAQARYKPPIAVVVGHERQGVSPEVLDFADTIIRIPMRGHAHSLNVSVACGIALFEITKHLQSLIPNT